MCLPSELEVNRTESFLRKWLPCARKDLYPGKVTALPHHESQCDCYDKQSARAPRSNNKVNKPAYRATTKTRSSFCIKLVSVFWEQQLTCRLDWNCCVLSPWNKILLIFFTFVSSKLYTCFRSADRVHRACYFSLSSELQKTHVIRIWENDVTTRRAHNFCVNLREQDAKDNKYSLLNYWIMYDNRLKIALQDRTMFSRIVGSDWNKFLMPSLCCDHCWLNILQPQLCNILHVI
jgi:hypothetical protein